MIMRNKFCKIHFMNKVNIKVKFIKLILQFKIIMIHEIHLFFFNNLSTFIFVYLLKKTYICIKLFLFEFFF